MTHKADGSTSTSMEDTEKGADLKVDGSVVKTEVLTTEYATINLHSYHETNAGRLVIDPEEAKREFGEEIAKQLKLSPDGKVVLWPQPTDDPDDPQNWSEGFKTLQLIIVTLAAVVPDFDSAIGVAAIFGLATDFHTTTGVINDVTTNWSIFALGWGSIVAVMLMRRYGRLPVLFWSQVLALAFLIGCTFSPNLNTFTVMRCLNSFFGTTPQVTGLYAVTDIFPFHRQARKLNVWTLGFVISPFLSPFAFTFLAARANWRWTYGIGSMYGAFVVFLITCFLRESMYDRTLPNPHPIPRPASALLYRVETLIGITGWRMARFRPSWRSVTMACMDLVWRPHLLPILVFEGMLFGFSAGINNTNTILLAEPKPGGYGFTQYAIAGVYGTPIVGVLTGELVGHYINDWVMNFCIKRNNGVFEAEMRLWVCYIAIPLYVCGFVVLGASFQEHLTVGALVMGWGIAQMAIMINTVAVYAYCSDCFPGRQGEISALVNLARTLGGFSIAYFQVPWVSRGGALQTFGCEAAVVAGLWLLVVPAIQFRGAYLRDRFSVSV